MPRLGKANLSKLNLLLRSACTTFAILWTHWNLPNGLCIIKYTLLAIFTPNLILIYGTKQSTT